MKKQDLPSQTNRQTWAEWGLILGFWSLMALLTIASRLLDSRPSPDPRRLVFAVFHLYLWLPLTPAIFWASSRYSIDHANWRSHVGLHLALAFAVALAIDFLSDLVLVYYVQPSWVDQVSLNPLRALAELDFLYEFMIYLAILAAGFARNYFFRYQERQEHTSRLETQLTRARLDALRMQINPHFLFNTLHAVSTLVERDPQGVRRMIARLSDLLRYTLEDSSNQEVRLRQELKFLDGYLDIQQIRFQGKMRIDKQIDEEVLDALVPNLILQPLVENAIKHGVSRTSGVGRITLHAGRGEGWLYLAVEDDGPGLAAPPMEETDGTGLRNTRARLEALYGEEHELRFETPDGGGLRVEIRIPYHTPTDLHASSVEVPA